MEEKHFKIVLETGIHARPATILVQAASRFKANLSLEYDGKAVNLKSIMGVMSLGVGQNAEIIVRADGEDEKAAIEQIAKTLQQEGLTN